MGNPLSIIANIVIVFSLVVRFVAIVIEDDCANCYPSQAFFGVILLCGKIAASAVLIKAIVTRWLDYPFSYSMYLLITLSVDFVITMGAPFGFGFSEPMRIFLAAITLTTFAIVARLTVLELRLPVKSRQ